MNSFPHFINSPNFKFVIVGPTGTYDGILIQGKNITPELIGVSNLIYSSNRDNPELDFFHGESIQDKTRNYKYAWSGKIHGMVDDWSSEQRNFEILFVWKDVGISDHTNKVLSEEFRKIAYDIYRVAFSGEMSSSEKASVLTWMLSPLILLGSRSK